MKTQFRATLVAAVLGCLGLSLTANAGQQVQQRGQVSGPPINTPLTPWVGERGINETVDEIMARQRATPNFQTPPPYYMGPEHEIDRWWIKPNPDSPKVSQWPPAPRGAQKAERGGGGRYTPQPVGTDFLGATLPESGYLPPDSNGAVGPTQILVVVNGRIKVFDRNGSVGPLNTSTSTFFNSVRNGAGVSDPQVRYDRLSGRWFVLMITTVNQNNRIVLAVSSGPTITGMASFTFFQFQQNLPAPAGNTGQFADYCSLGIDANALYVGCNMFNGSFNTTAWVIKKSSVLGAGPIEVTAFRNLLSGGVGPFAPRGVDNDDPSSTQGYIVGVDAATFGKLMFRRINDPGGTPSISGNLSLTVPTTGYPQNQVAMGSTGALDGLDDRLFAATLHKNQLTGVQTLWTAHNIEVNSSGVASSSGNRNGSRWYEVGNLSTVPTLIQSGTLFDASATPLGYWIPSVAMSGQGHMVLGSSVAGSTRRADVQVAGRFASDLLGTIQSPTFVTATGSNYNVQSGTQRWGDYSATLVDPLDGMTMWTFQEYCNATNSWAVRVTQLIAPPPASITTLVPNAINQGQTLNITVNGTSSGGSGFFDPDPSFPNHIAALFSGSGLTVNSINFVTPTQIVLNVSASGGAATGARDLTVTNPDGQSTVKTSALTVNGGGGPIDVVPATMTVGPGLRVSGTVADLFTSNDQYVDVRKNLAAEEVGANIEVLLTTTCPTATPSALEVSLESRIQISGVKQWIRLWDYTASAWVQIDDRFIGTSDTTITVAAPGSLSRFVQAGTRTMRMKIGLREVAAETTQAWHAWLDRAIWRVTQ
ncbi:MAG: hypothetical protein M9921_01560 [Fimbriimonadaceae bacterium]|nr:hypothetical protein [Fimbriimonadaceae bacterium]